MSDGDTSKFTLQTILPVKPGAISELDRAALREVGVLVFEHPEPETVRLIMPMSETEHGAMLNMAVKALSSCDGPIAKSMREYFARLVMDHLQKGKK